MNNYNSGDVVHHSLILLTGEIITPSSGNDKHHHNSQDLIVTYNALDQASWPIHNNQFKAIVQLHAGDNTIHLETSNDQAAIHIHYELPLTTKFVRPIYIVCTDDDSHGQFQGPEGTDCSSESACSRIALGTRLLQSFTAEKLREHGLGRKTFALECDLYPSRPPCRVFRSKLTLKQAYSMSGGELWMYFAKELMSSSEFDHKDCCKWFAFMSFTRYAPPGGGGDRLLPRSHSEVLQFTKGHTALGMSV